MGAAGRDGWAAGGDSGPLLSKDPPGGSFPSFSQQKLPEWPPGFTGSQICPRVQRLSEDR